MLYVKNDFENHYSTGIAECKGLILNISSKYYENEVIPMNEEQIGKGHEKGKGKGHDKGHGKGHGQNGQVTKPGNSHSVGVFDFWRKLNDKCNN